MNTDHQTQQAKLLTASLASTQTLTRATPWLLVGAIVVALNLRPMSAFDVVMFLLVQAFGLLQLWLGWRLDLDRHLFKVLGEEPDSAQALDHLIGLIKTKPTETRDFESRQEGTLNLLRRWLGVTLLFWTIYMGLMGMLLF